MNFNFIPAGNNLANESWFGLIAIEPKTVIVKEALMVKAAHGLIIVKIPGFPMHFLRMTDQLFSSE